MVDPVVVRNIAIVLPDMIGTTVCAIPAVNAVYAGFPHAAITLFGFDPVSRFLIDEPYGTDLVLCAARDLAAHTGHLVSSFDLVFDMLGTPESLGAVAVCRARWLVSWPDRAGHVNVPVPCPAGRHQSAVQDYLDFAVAAGVPAHFASPRLRALRKTRERANAWLTEQGVAEAERVFVLGVGGGNRRKRWPLDHFVDLERRLGGRGRSVYVLGPSEPELTESLGVVPSRIIADSLPLDLAKGVIARASLAVCNDYAIMHMAAALAVPTVGVFLASDPDEWFPYAVPSSCVVGPRLDCRPCYSESCERWRCNDSALPARVDGIVEELLR